MKKQKLRIPKGEIALSLALAGSGAWAQTAPDIGNVLHQAQPPIVPAPAVPALPPVGGTPQPIEPAMTEVPGGAQVPVKSIEIVGNRAIDTATLAALVADGPGQSLTLSGLEALAQRITHHYRSRGYFVARAYIPAQDATAGMIRIRVIEGSYGQFHLKNASLVGDDIVQGILDRTKIGEAVSLESLERSLLIVNDTPGARVARADAMPGEMVGTSDFAVETAPTAPYAGYAMADNFGSRYTGRNRLSFNVDAVSPTGRGDRFSISGLSTDTGDLVNGRLAYSILLSPDGLRGEMAVSQTEYQLGDIYKSLDAKGSARAVDAALIYPIRRTRAQTVEATFNLAYKDLEDKVHSTGTRTPKTLTAVSAGLTVRDEGTFFGLEGLTQGKVEISIGDLRIEDADARMLDRAGPRTQGGYHKLAVGLSRISRLPLDLSLTASVRHQRSLNDKNLDSSERMAVSGYTGVMAYPTGELIGTNATVARLELARPLPPWQELRHSWLAFADWGQASATNPIDTADRRREISDVGLGWVANYGGLLLRTYVAHRLNSRAPTSEPAPRDKFLLQAGWVF